jgi:hypothetical protein
MWSSTVVIDSAAGVVDDLAVAAATAMGATQAVTDQYDGFAGPTQQAVGGAIRSVLDWSAHNLPSLSY